MFNPVIRPGLTSYPVALYRHIIMSFQYALLCCSYVQGSVRSWREHGWNRRVQVQRHPVCSQQTPPQSRYIHTRFAHTSIKRMVYTGHKVPMNTLFEEAHLSAWFLNTSRSDSDLIVSTKFQV